MISKARLSYKLNFADKGSRLTLLFILLIALKWEFSLPFFVFWANTYKRDREKLNKLNDEQDTICILDNRRISTPNSLLELLFPHDEFCHFILGFASNDKYHYWWIDTIKHDDQQGKNI